MRAFVVAGLVVFHSAMVFSSFQWRVNNAQTSVAFDALIVWGASWGMPLLFAVSGMGVWHALGRRSASAFVRERTVRLLVPFVFGLIVLVPPMFYLQDLQTPGFNEPYWQFWLQFFNLPALVPGLLSQSVWSSGPYLFDVGHLWFLYVLFLFSIVLLPIFIYLRRPHGRSLVDGLASAAERQPFLLLLMGAVPMGAVEAFFGAQITSGGWARPAYFVPLLFGYILASNYRLGGALRRSRWPMAVLAVFTTVALLYYTYVLAGSQTDPLSYPWWGALQGLTGWAWILAFLGFGESWSAKLAGRSRPRTGSRLARAGQYANEAVLPFYVLHLPVIAGAAWFIVLWDAPILAKYLALVFVSFGVTLGLYELVVRRLRVMRFLFGMRAAQAS